MQDGAGPWRRRSRRRPTRASGGRRRDARASRRTRGRRDALPPEAGRPGTQVRPQERCGDIIDEGTPSRVESVAGEEDLPLACRRRELELDASWLEDEDARRGRHRRGLAEGRIVRRERRESAGRLEETPVLGLGDGAIPAKEDGVREAELVEGRLVRVDELHLVADLVAGTRPPDAVEVLTEAGLARDEREPGVRELVAAQDELDPERGEETRPLGRGPLDLELPLELVLPGELAREVAVELLEAPDRREVGTQAHLVVLPVVLAPRMLELAAERRFATR